jgi:isopenicillin-N epimerase
MNSITEPLISRDEWLLDPEITFLNHGSFGAVPLPVLCHQRSLQVRLERNPTRFLVDELPGALRAAAEKLAGFVGGVGNDYVFVENATAGCNTVLNSIRFEPGDEILAMDHGYPAVLLAAQQTASRTGAKIVQAKVPFPLLDDAQVIQAVESALSPRTRLVILDHVSSPTALVFPVHRLTQICRSAGARVLIDGAHAPGMLSLDIPTIKADWYVGNCHKWLMAPKGSAFIWASPARQNEIHPLVTSHGSGKGSCAEFDWVGTRDPTAWLSVSAAIEWHLNARELSLCQRNASLLEHAAVRLATIWKTEVGSPLGSSAAMKTIRLPVCREATTESAQELRASLLRDHRIDAAIIPFEGRLWARISVQAYNSLSEYLHFAEVVSDLSKR